MANTSTDERTDLKSLKVPDLKKMLKARGLSVVGNKEELINRLQSSEAAAEALLEGSEVGDIIDEEIDRELDETALDDEPSKDDEEVLKKESEKPPTESTLESIKTAEDPKPVEADKKAEVVADKDKLNGSSMEGENKTQPEKHKRITISDVDGGDAAARKKARLERFNQAPKEASGVKTKSVDVLAKRAARFSGEANADKASVAPAVPNTPQDGQPKNSEAAKPAGGPEKLKLRAERFGILSPAELKKQQLEKLQARKARFASTPATPAGPTEVKKSIPPITAIKTAASIEEKKRIRAERFKSKS